MNCPKCNSEQNTVKDGITHGKQRYYCKNCDLRFTEKPNTLKECPLSKDKPTLQTPELIQPLNQPIKQQTTWDTIPHRKPSYTLEQQQQFWLIHPKCCPECYFDNHQIVELIYHSDGSIFCGTCGLILRMYDTTDAKIYGEM